jgi:hypothetical protein
MSAFHELFRNAGNSKGAKEGWLNRMRGIHQLVQQAQQATTNSVIKGGNGVDASFHAQDATRHALRADHFAHEEVKAPAYELASNAHQLAARANRDASVGGGRHTSMHKSLASFHEKRARELDREAENKPGTYFYDSGDGPKNKNR